MEQSRKKTKVSHGPVTGGTVLGLPFELTLRIFLSSMTEGTKLAQLKTLRLVTRECNALATDLLIEHYIELLEKRLEQVISLVSTKYEHAGEELAGTISETLNAISQMSEELTFLKRKVDEKKEARHTIFKMPSIDAPTKLQLLKACSFDSEFLTLRGIAERVLKEHKALEKSRERSRIDPLAVPGPLGPFPPHPGRPSPYPFGPAPNIFGEPGPDHLPPPDWERDRNPPGFNDPSSPFFLPDPSPNPFNPFGGGGRGGRGGRGGGGGWHPRYL